MEQLSADDANSYEAALIEATCKLNFINIFNNYYF